MKLGKTKEDKANQTNEIFQWEWNEEYARANEIRVQTFKAIFFSPIAIMGIPSPTQ